MRAALNRWWNTCQGLTLNQESVDWRAPMESTHCTAPDCTRPIQRPTKGLCEMHYYRLRRNGRLDLVKVSTTERFWSLVDKSGGPESCWFWRAYRGPRGYGMFSVKRSTVSAHRFAYELTVGPIPDGLHIDHLCRQTGCVNPAHLEPVTMRENARRKELATDRSKCIQGHVKDESNSLQPRPGLVRTTSFCRQCQLVRTHKRRGHVCDFDAFCDRPSHLAPDSARQKAI